MSAASSDEDTGGFAEGAGPAPSPNLASADGPAQVLASRICHDLVSPVGAIANGVDLLREIGGQGAEAEIAMIGQSAERASAILAFHRLAFGAAGTSKSEIARPALVRTLEPMIASPRIGFEATGTDGPALPRVHARLAAVMALAGRALTGMRGTVVLAMDANAPLPLAVSLDAGEAERRAPLLARIGASAPPTPQTVEFDMMAPLAAAAGARVRIDESGPGLTLHAEPG